MQQIGVTVDISFQTRVNEHLSFKLDIILLVATSFSFKLFQLCEQ